MSGKITPMLSQYLEIKGRHPEAMLLFRMGDFYETFFEDAERLAAITGVVLTSRDRNSAHPVPLAGIPHHALDTYLGRLLEAGLTVAICDQVEDPAQARGLVKREVVQIISPGTAMAPELIRDATGLYCLAFAPGERGEAGWAILDASTGDFRCGQERVTLADLCERHPVREVIVREDTDGQRLSEWRAAQPQVVVNGVSSAWFHPNFAVQVLRDHFRVQSLDPFGLDVQRSALATTAAGALLRYFSGLHLKRPDQIGTLRYSSGADHMLLDEETLRNLEIFRTFRGERGQGTLLFHIDATLTPMGRRLLERRLAEAMTDLAELDRWHGGVEALLQAREWRTRLRGVLRRVGDIERDAARAAAGRLGPAQLRQLGLSLRSVEILRAEAAADRSADHPLVAWALDLPDLELLADRILGGLPDKPPALLRSGGAIRDGVAAELDENRRIASDTKGFLAGLQEQERRRTGIPTLKIGYNKVFGYYFEVTNKHLDKVPPDYVQRQTLVNACRYHTEDLKAAEHKILLAEEKAAELEKRLYEEILAAVKEHLAAIGKAAANVAAIDLMLAFADLAERHNYCRPHCEDSCQLDLKGGRHPVIEQLLDHDFIANDTLLDGRDRQILLLTGPNMGGKSTYLRQVAVIVLMAQIGSFVPAAAARIGVADRIFTRVGAGDNLARGQSTFFREMSETAHILHQMSRRSLVILDEIGRGTSTYDGLSLAWAITEYLHAEAGPRPRTVFATHYHELTELDDRLNGLVNLRMDVKEWEGKIIFLHAVKPGRSDKSYGIHVARLAGVPECVLRRATAILAGLAAEDQQVLRRGSFRAGIGGASLAADSADSGAGSAMQLPCQLNLFGDRERDALEAIRQLDLERISPVDSFMWLMKIKMQLNDKK